MNIMRVDVFAALPARRGDRATGAAAIREAHGRSESYHAAHMPDLVVFPESAAEVVDIVKICKHPNVRDWLSRHPRWTFHFTPTSASWLNAVEG